ncbi:MAG: Fe-S cluster assembly protein SufB, partial [Pseudomonadota bacterium]
MDSSSGLEERKEVIVKDGIEQETVDAAKALEAENYSAGFVTDVETEFAPKGLNEDIIRFISEKKEEPEWMLEWRLAAYERWLSMEEPDWAMVDYPAIDYQDIYYYAAPKAGAKYESIDDVP